MPRHHDDVFVGPSNESEDKTHDLDKELDLNNQDNVCPICTKAVRTGKNGCAMLFQRDYSKFSDERFLDILKNFPGRIFLMKI